MLYESRRNMSPTPGRFGAFDQREVRLTEEIASDVHHELTRRLDIHRTTGHRHQRLAQRNQIGCDIGISIRERSRVHAGYEESRDSEQSDYRIAYQRQIEIARAGSVGVEGGAVLPPRPGD